MFVLQIAAVGAAVGAVVSVGVALAYEYVCKWDISRITQEFPDLHKKAHGWLQTVPHGAGLTERINQAVACIVAATPKPNPCYYKETAHYRERSARSTFTGTNCAEHVQLLAQYRITFKLARILKTLLDDDTVSDPVSVMANAARYGIVSVNDEDALCRAVKACCIQ